MFVDIFSDGVEVNVVAEKGISILELAHKNKIDLEGACEGSLACSTCHVILSQGAQTQIGNQHPLAHIFLKLDLYDNLDEPNDEEQDMLDLAYGLTDT